MMGTDYWRAGYAIRRQLVPQEMIDDLNQRFAGIADGTISQAPNMQIARNVEDAFRTPHTPQNIRQPRAHHHLTRKRGIKETQQTFLFRLLFFHIYRQPRSDRVDTESFRDTRCDKRQKEVPLTRLFDTNSLENFLETCYNLFRVSPFTGKSHQNTSAVC